MTVTTEKLKEIKYPILLAPFHGVMVPIKVRELTQAQIMSCGDFSLIETFQDKIRQKSSKIHIREIIAYSERNHELVKLALVSPTYDEIMTIFKGDKIVKESKEKLKALKEKLIACKPGPKRKALEEEIDATTLLVDYLLPGDFLSFVVAYSLGVDKSDIKQISEDMLIEAATLAKLGHDNPADHIGGRFTSFMRDDINKRAWYLYFERQNKKNNDLGGLDGC